MKSPRILATTLAALLAGASSSHAANFIWDTVTGDAAAITPGSGIWDLVTTNTLWNSAAANVGWTNGNTAVFGGFDGTYAITLGTAISTAGLSFTNSGYTLSAASPLTLTNTSSAVTVAAGKTATIGSNVTLSRAGGYIFGGGGRLIVSGAINNSGTNATEITGGTTLEIQSGGSVAFSASPVVGGNSVATNLDGNLLVSGGSLSVASVGQLVIGNFGSGTTNAVAGITSGSISINAGSANGIRFGSTAQTGGTINGTFNLDGGTVTTPAVSRITPTGAGVINATFNFNGGTLVANKANATFLQNLSAANVKPGGAKIDSNGLAITIAQNLLDAGGGLEKLGAGTLTLTGTNTYSGTSTISGGTLQIGAGGTSGTLGTGAIVNNGTLALNRSDSLMLASGISGSGSVSLNGAGIVILGGANTYTGATNLNAGRADIVGSLTSNLTIASGASLGGEGSTTGSLTFGGLHTLFFDPTTAAALTANTVTATGATISLSLSAGAAAGTGIVVLQVPGGITGTAGVGGNFQFAGRGTTYLNATNTQLLFDYTPATLKWKGGDATNPGFWDVNTTANWSNSGTLDKFITGDSVLLDDTATSFLLNVQSPAPQPGIVTFSNSINPFTLQGVGLAGTGSVVKNGTGTVIVANNNTYAGTTSLNAGTIQLGDGTNATGSFGTGLVTNNAAIVTDFGGTAVTLAASIAGTGTLTQSGFGTVSLTGANSYLGTTFINAGTLQIGAGGTSGTLGGGAVVNNAALAFNRADNFTATNAISGPGGILKLGPGTLTLGGSNTYSGATTISAGAILVSASSGVLGDTTSGTSVSAGGALQLQGNVIVTGETLSLVGDGANAVTAPGALRNMSGDNEWAGDVTIFSAVTTRVASDAGSLKISGNVVLSPIASDQFVLQGNGNGEISGVLSGFSRVTRSVTGTGSWSLSGANTFSGKTTISNGFLRVTSLNSVVGGSASSSLGAPTTLASGTIDFGNTTFAGGLIYAGSGETTDRVLNLAALGTGGASIEQAGSGLLKFTGNLTATGTGTKTLTLLGSSTGAGEFAGNLGNGSSIVGITKAGAGTWTLSGANTYTGATNITAGTLALTPTGLIATSSSINISADARLDVSAFPGGFTLAGAQSLTGGSGVTPGQIAGSLNADPGSTLAPGLGAGTTGKISISAGFSLAAGAHLALDLAGSAAGSGYDQIVVNGGAISLAGDLTGSTLTFTPNYGDVFFLILNAGAAATGGTLGGIPEGGSIFLGAQEFRISYTSDFGGAGIAFNGSGNDVALQAVPEPGSAALFLAGFGALLGLRRRLSPWRGL